MAENKKVLRDVNLMVGVPVKDMGNPEITDRLTGETLRNVLMDAIERTHARGCSYAEIAEAFGIARVTLVPIKDEEGGNK